MNLHDQILELAAARLDFDLAPAERRSLDDHLHGCARCRGDVAGLDDDARRIASRQLRTLAPARAIVLRDGVVHAGQGWRPAMLLVAAGLLLLLGLAVATGGGLVERVDRLLRGQAAPPAIPLPVVVAADGWTATMLATGEGKGAEVGWIYAEGAAGWISVGGSCRHLEKPPGDCTAEIRWSPDGLTWPAHGDQIEIVPPSGAFTQYLHPFITDVAAADDGFVATAYTMTDGIDGASALWSPDGRRWESHSLGAATRAATVIRTAQGWMIGGSLERGGEQVAAIWTSPDGRAWTWNQDDPMFDVGVLQQSLDDRFEPGVRDMAAMDGLIVATGYDCPPSGWLWVCKGAAWVSTDGRTWARNDPDTYADLPTFTTALDDRIITMAYTGAGEFTRVFAFDPSSGWTMVKFDLPSVHEAVPVDGGVAVVTSDSTGDETIRYSLDGRTWSDVAVIDTPDVPGMAGDASLSGHTLLIDARDGGVRAHWTGILPGLEPDAWPVRSADWLFEPNP